jgi:hypothetical protein
VSIVVDIQTVSIAIASGSVVLAAIYYIFQIRHQSKMRQTDLVVRLYSTWQSKELSDATLKVWNLEFKDYNDFVKKYGPFCSETEVYSAFRMVCNFFAGIGILLHVKLVGVEMVARLFGLPTITTWEKVQLIVEGARRALGSQLGHLFFEDFEYLYNEIKKYEQKLQQSTAEVE